MTRRPLCGTCEDGWIVDAETGLPVDRCPCRTATVTPAAAKQAGQAQAADAHPGQLDAAVRIIRDAADTFPVLSSNDTREALFHAGVTGPIVGAAFARCVKLGYIEPDGFTPSTDPGTHAHPVRTYASRRYGRRTA